MIGKTRMRVSVSPTIETVREVDKLAKEVGTSRSMLCNMFIKQGVDSFKQVRRIPNEKMNAIAELFEEEKN